MRTNLAELAVALPFMLSLVGSESAALQSLCLVFVLEIKWDI